MRLPNNGRIAIIDDLWEEAGPLFSVFSKKGIPSLYFDGKLINLPKNPIAGLRFLFLDLDLKGMPKSTGNGGIKNMASYAAGVVTRLVDESNGPFVIIFWSKHSKDGEIIKRVLLNCKKKGVIPSIYVDMEKHMCKTRAGVYSLSLISKNLKKKLSNIGAFQLYVEWENLIHTASTEFVRDFSRHVPLGTDWSEQTGALFHKLYMAYVGPKNKISSSVRQFRCACNLLNRSFQETLQNLSHERLSLPSGFKLNHGVVKNEIVAKINSSLFFNTNFRSKPATGYIYEENNVSIRRALKRIVFKKRKPPHGSKLCKIVITPECDIAQDKLLHAPRKVHRVVYGLLFPKSQDRRSKGSSPQSEFLIGPFWNDDKEYLFVFHFSTINFQSESEFLSSPLFSIKRDLMFDLQSKAANHVNRLGNFQLSV